MNYLNNFPLKLQEFLEDKEVKKHTIGHSDSDVFQISNQNNAQRWFLKILRKKKSYNSLAYEKEVLTWLNDKTLVPKIEFYIATEEYEYLVISELKGMILSSKENISKNPRKTIEEFAKGLKTLHEIEIKDCPFKQDLQVKIEIASRNVYRNHINKECFLSEFRHLSPGEMLDFLVKNKPQEDLVFTHGDYTLPNVIYDGNQVGFIDLGLSGVSDKYMDIAVAIKTIRFNLNILGLEYLLNELIDLFCFYYGILQLNEKKIEYYLMLDDLF